MDSQNRDSFLPPAYVVRREGTVFTGVCLLTSRGEGGFPGLRFSDRLIQPWTGVRKRVPGLRFLDRLIQPWTGGGGGLRSQIFR